MGHDLIIIGGGPAGLSAAIYAVRRGLDTIVITREFGARAQKIHKMENYLGVISTTGPEFMKTCLEQAKKLGAEIVQDEVMELKKNGDKFVARTASDAVYEAKAVIIATGIQSKELGVPGEKEYAGKGVSYCATCDAPFFRNQKVIVVGNGNPAAHAAIVLKGFAKEVKLVCEKKDMDPHLLGKLKQQGISCVVGKVEKIKGDKFVKSVIINGKEEPANGVFIELGVTQTIDLIAPLGVEMDGNFIKTDKAQATNIPGIFAAGDVCDGILQVVSAAYMGAVAALSAYGYVHGIEEK